MNGQCAGIGGDENNELGKIRVKGLVGAARKAGTRDTSKAENLRKANHPRAGRWRVV